MQTMQPHMVGQRERISMPCVQVIPMEQREEERCKKMSWYNIMSIDPIQLRKTLDKKKEMFDDEAD